MIFSATSPSSRKERGASWATAVFAILFSATLASSGLPPVDYRFEPPLWHTPIGLPGDWHKPLVDETGALVYDFGPGPYARPNTRVGFSYAEGDPAVSGQTIKDPRVPIVVTERAGGLGSIATESFALMPDPGWERVDASVYAGPVRRLNGLNSCLGWATPSDPVDRAFQNVAVATNRPLIYRVQIPVGEARKVVLGLADPYRERGHRVKRVMILAVEGAAEQVVDVVDQVGQNVPLVVSFDAVDENEDGWIDIELRAARDTVDGNLFLNVLWVFGAKERIDEDRLIRGELSAQAEHYIDCGRDPELLTRSARQEVIEARFESEGGTPILEVTTRRVLEFDGATGALISDGDPFIHTRPRAVEAIRTETGWQLMLPEGTREAVAMVSRNRSQVGMTDWRDLDEERARLARYWRDDSGLPWNTITVSDQGIQTLLEGCIRTMYQLTERVDGKLQSQPGPSVYRGLWVSNQPRVCRALAHLGDFETARSSLAQTWRFQEGSGRIVVLTPPILLKETGTAMEAIWQHARLSRDREFLESYWPAMKRAGEWIRWAREQVTDAEALNFGLMPAGMSDGGVGGIIPEYTSVYWNLLGTKNLVAAAAWLGEFEEAARYEVEYQDFETAFRKAAARDLSQDKQGNWYLPIPMAFDSATQQAQRSMTQFSYMVYPGRLFARDDPLVFGNMAMLADVPRAEGLLVDTGWLDGGVQPFIECIRAGARLYLGDVEQAQQTLYAVANHAAPTHVWIEEQIPGTGPRKATGDVPHSSGSSEFINLVRYFVAIEDGDHLDLLKGMPPEWIFPGARIEMKSAPTEFGELSMKLTVSDDGRETILQVEPLEGPFGATASGAGGLRIHLNALKALGFEQVEGGDLPDVWGAGWGTEVKIRMNRESPLS